MKYLNLSGLTYFLNKIKSAVSSELDGKSDVGHTHTVSDVTDFPTLATVATSGSYNDLSNKPTTMTPTSHTHGNITNDGKIGSNANKPLITTTGGTVTTGSFGTSANTFCEGNDSRLSDARTPTSHTHVKSEITDFPSLATVATSGSYNDLTNKPTIPTVNNATLTIQKNGTTVKTFTANASSNVTANITVPTKVSELDNDSNYLTSVPNIDASKITSGTIDIARLPQGALERLVTVTNKTARFALTTSTVQIGDVVKQTDTGIMYYVVDTANLNSEDGYSEFTAGSATSVPWSGVTGKPSSYTPSSHTHGNITNAGAIGSTANKPLITTTNGVITTGSFGTTANTFCQGNDSRLSDARTPTAHTHSASDITSGLATVATSGSYNDLSNKPTIPTVNNATLTIQKNGTTVKTFTANASSNVTANITVPTKTSDLTNDSHVSITTETDTTSTGTPAHGGTFTCIDSVTRDSNGHVTKVNTKTVTLPSDSNTDTLVTQNVSTANENHPILLSATKDATTNQGAKTSIFASGVKVNPSTNTVTATTFSGTLSGNASSATQFSANKSVTLTGDVTGTASSKAGWSVATTLANSGVTAGTYGPGANVTGNNNATISVPEITVDAKGRVTSVTNRTLTCKNNTYTVNNKTLTIQKNGTNVATFTSNSNTDVTANISVPTKTSDLTNDSCIPLSGTNSITGTGFFKSTSDSQLQIGSGTSTVTGGCFVAYGSDYSNSELAGSFRLRARKTSNYDLLGKDDGTLTWGNKNVAMYEDVVPRSGGAVSGSLNFSSTWDYTSSNQGWFPNTFNWYAGNVNLGYIGIYDDIRRQIVLNVLDHNGVMKSVLSAGIDESNNIIVISDNKKLATQEDTVPRSGGSVMTGTRLAKSVDNSGLRLDGGSDWNKGGSVVVNGKDNSASAGTVYFHAYDGTNGNNMYLRPNGTWTWDGTAVQIISDQRLKQQITEIDDKLLDAWEDVELSQFKYNDAVDQKGDTARLHTGYVVQQIDEACQKHNIDISEYGLYCHEEYPEETEEVEVENEDGTKTKETKVVREASEHYSLRYTETLVVECAYLRKRIKELEERLEKLEGK